MNKFKSSIIIFVLTPILFFAQNKEVDVDSLYNEARQLYSAKQYDSALSLTRDALFLTPEYHEIRVFQIQLEQDNEQLENAEKDINYLLSKSNTLEVKPSVLKQIVRYTAKEKLLAFHNQVGTYYTADVDYNLSLAEALLSFQESHEAKRILDTIQTAALTHTQNYRLQDLLKRMKANQIGVNYEFISFLKAYPINKSWNGVSLDYTRFIGKHAITARAVYSDRFNKDGILYELEGYPVFSKKLYSYVSINASGSDFFQNFGGSLSLYYSIKNIIEMEAGFRYLEFDSGSFFTPVIGATKYMGRFYVNGRAYIGPREKRKINTELSAQHAILFKRRWRLCFYTIGYWYFTR
ncbi:YaiO family outer membrane beta-barrel protein [Lacinutrix neustonica]|uniref:YaiO family outer membrane beta-barrel protein n=1 Tax=Lacinutrix neustonica TaxID=2980107 RepID=A0A9E8SDT1_9FLAO|nr:YaiO family outer membrane beta-barrel protein [Lacinutrix neustonica]WAC02436.1 YaiO family outer membrane beta-barrel protein [Lacinutrix neustonica]